MKKICPFFVVFLLFVSCASKPKIDFYQIGNTYEEQQDYTNALINYAKINKKNKDYYNALLRTALIQFKLGNYEEALSNFTYIINDDKDCDKLKCFYNRGLVYYQLENYKEALSDFLFVINNNDLDSDAYTMIGNCFAQLKEYENALVYYNEALIRNPNDLQASKNSKALRRFVK